MNYFEKITKRIKEITSPGLVTYPLTKPQKMLISTQLYSVKKKDEPQVNLLGACAIVENDFDIYAMEKAFQHFIKVNDSYRIRLVFNKFRLRQTIQDYEYAPLEYKTVGDIEEFHKEAEQCMYHRIGLFDKKLYRAELVDYGEGKGGIIMMFHHLTCDGYSLSLMFEQLSR